jgi:DNA primase catalytic core
MLSQEEISRIKEGVELVPFMQACGIELKKVGSNYRGLCPFHKDSNPSLTVNPKNNLWNCFGCDKGGDNIRFVQLFDRISFNEAVMRLQGYFPKGRLPKTAVKEKKPTIKSGKLLAQVMEQYQYCLGENPKGLAYLKQRGISNISAIRDFGTGFVDGSMKNLLPRDDTSIQELQDIGILNKKGNEVFYNCVVFPLYDSKGTLVNIYGRNISKSHGVTHLYLAGSTRGLVNRKAAMQSESIILAESIIDALTLYNHGFSNVIPVYGVNGLTEEHLFLFSRKTKKIFLAFDNDQAGIRGMDKAAKQLGKLDIACYPVSLPVKDCNLFFKDHGAEEFEQLLLQSLPGKEQTGTKCRRQSMYREEERGFRVGYGKRQYQIKGIQRADTRLKATIRASINPDNSGEAFELTTVDLYSSRSREWFAKLCATLFNDPETLIKEDIARLMVLVEEWTPAKEEQEKEIVITADEKKAAMKFLQNPEMFSEILHDFDTMGVTGEETNKLVGYLAATSRKLADPLSIMIQSRSAAGKSTMQDAILDLIPEEEYEKYTRMSDQALFYKGEESLVHKVLAIEEAEGMGGAAYAIRNIQSAKQITMAVTGKDPNTGEMETREYTVKGPVCVMLTTTATEIDQETASRFIFLTIDESTAMTEAIHRIQRESESLDGLIRDKKQDRIIKKHHAAQRILKALAVVNPFAEYLSYPAASLGSRRDHKKYLGLIRVVAFIHQFQREIKRVTVDGEEIEYIEVSLEDIELANRLANEVLGQTMDELAKPSRTLLAQIFTMVEEMAKEQDRSIDEIFFTRRMIREKTGWTDWQVRTHIKQLQDLEYLYVRQGHMGKEYAYILKYRGQAGESERCFLHLTSVEQIKAMIKQ